MCGVSLSTAVTPSKSTAPVAEPRTSDAATSPVTQATSQAPTDLFETKTPPKAPVALDPWADAPAWDQAGTGGGGTAAIDPSGR